MVKTILQQVDNNITQTLHGKSSKSDFNSLQTSHCNKYLNLSEIVKEPTRKNNIVDKIFTNCSNFYASPTILSPVGKSDHNCVLSNLNVTMHTIKWNRKLPQNRIYLNKF